MVYVNNQAETAKRTVRRFRRRNSMSPFADQFVDQADERVQVSFADDDRRLLMKLLESHAQLTREFRRDREERRKEDERREREDDRREAEVLELRAASTLAAGAIEQLKTDKVRMQAVSGVILLIGAGVGTIATGIAVMIEQWVAKHLLN